MCSALAAPSRLRTAGATSAKTAVVIKTEFACSTLTDLVAAGHRSSRSESIAYIAAENHPSWCVSVQMAKLIQALRRVRCILIAWEQIQNGLVLAEFCPRNVQ